ncbi:hypothetical protein [Ruminococcus hominis]|nr:hypothetical protein [Ruminococcus hominis]
MARQKKPVYRVQMTEGKRNIIHQFLEDLDEFINGYSHEYSSLI